MKKTLVAKEMLVLARALVAAPSEGERVVVVDAIAKTRELLSSLDMLVDKMSYSKEKDISLQAKRVRSINTVKQAMSSLSNAHKALAGAFHLGYFSTSNR